MSRSCGSAARYLALFLETLRDAEALLPQATALAAMAADRYVAGGGIGFPRPTAPGLAQELTMRSGQIIHVGFNHTVDGQRVAEKDMLILSSSDKSPRFDTALFRRPPGFVVGLGRARTASAKDSWLDIPPRVPATPRATLLCNVLAAWVFFAELMAACTRRGKVPAIAKSYWEADGRDWWDRYYRRHTFHPDLQLAPVAGGLLGQAYVDSIRRFTVQLHTTQLATIETMAGLIVDEVRRKRIISVTWSGHLCPGYAGLDDAAVWARATRPGTPGAMGLHIGYFGLPADERERVLAQGQRLLLISSGLLPTVEEPIDLLAYVNLGWEFGDACVVLPGYPFRVLPPSGILQLLAYEALHAEVLRRLNLGDSQVTVTEV